METYLKPNSISDYKKFIAIKSLPRFSFTGRQAKYPDEYSLLLNENAKASKNVTYNPSPFLFDYQKDISRLAINKKKFAVFADCGLGKTLIMAEFARHAATAIKRGKRVLIVSPLMVVNQTVNEVARFYPGTSIDQVKSKDLQRWLDSKGDTIGVTNYDAIKDCLTAGNLGALILDESSMLKSMYGKWGAKLIDLGKGLEWKLCLTGTPAPNDRIEYGNHAVFLDQYPTLNAFLARFFVNRGQTDNRWELKPHAIEPFYRSISHWAIFLNNPATYGWKDNTETIPAVNVHIQHIDLTEEQNDITRQSTGELFASSFGGISSRGTLARIAKGTYKGEAVATNKYDAIKSIIDQEPDRSTIIWCLYNDEQERNAAMFPDAANIDGSTPEPARLQLIEDFKAGKRKILISKSKILGFGLNLQICTRMVFSSLQDSYESYYQSIKRANRYGSTIPLDVYIPVSDLEMPMVETVLEKAKMVNEDTTKQEQLFLKTRITNDTRN